MSLPSGPLWGAALLGLALATGAVAAPSQSDISREINLVTQAATNVIAALQDRINSGKLPPAAVEANALRAAFVENLASSPPPTSGKRRTRCWRKSGPPSRTPSMPSRRNIGPTC